MKPRRIYYAFILAEARLCVRHHLIFLPPFKFSTIDASGNMIQLEEQKERAEKFTTHLHDIIDFANSQECVDWFAEDFVILSSKTVPDIE